MVAYLILFSIYMLIFVGIGLIMLWVEKRSETNAKDERQATFAFFPRSGFPKLTFFPPKTRTTHKTPVS